MRRPERSREPYPRSSKTWNVTPLAGATTSSDAVGSLTPLPRDNWTRNTLQGDDEARDAGGVTGHPAPSGDVRQIPNIWTPQTVVVPSQQGDQVRDQVIRTPWKVWEMEQRANEDGGKELVHADTTSYGMSSSSSSNQRTRLETSGSTSGWTPVRSQSTQSESRELWYPRSPEVWHTAKRTANPGVQNPCSSTTKWGPNRSQSVQSHAWNSWTGESNRRRVPSIGRSSGRDGTFPSPKARTRRLQKNEVFDLALFETGHLNHKRSKRTYGRVDDNYEVRTISKGGKKTRSQRRQARKEQGIVVKDTEKKVREHVGSALGRYKDWKADGRIIEIDSVDELSGPNICRVFKELLDTGEYAPFRQLS